MKLGFSPVTAAILDLDEAFELADELELDFIELSHDLHEVMPALQEPGKVQQLSRATGIGTTVHLSFVDLNLASVVPVARETAVERTRRGLELDRKSTRLNSSHVAISYAVFCLKKK